MKVLEFKVGCRNITYSFCILHHNHLQPITVSHPPALSTCYNHFIPIVGVGNRGAYKLAHGDLPRQHSFGTTLRFTGPVPTDYRQ